MILFEGSRVVLLKFECSSQLLNYVMLLDIYNIKYHAIYFVISTHNHDTNSLLFCITYDAQLAPETSLCHPKMILEVGVGI